MMPFVLSSLVFPELSGCILFAPSRTPATYLHNDLLCNGTCSVSALHNSLGGTNGLSRIFGAGLKMADNCLDGSDHSRGET